MPLDTQTDSRSRLRDLFASPWLLALVVTSMNAVKPVLVDDTAYITYARHFAAHPLDPYGFEMFWWTLPDSAMTVLVPPVLPYWLSINIAIFGEHPWPLKLWLFPFLFAFAWSLRELLRRFARGTESRILPLVMLSPAVLPTVNLMLDIPAMAFGLASIAVFLRSFVAGLTEAGPGSQTPATKTSWLLVIVAGLLAGLAMQTKYTALLIPPAILWYGLTHRRILHAFVAVGIAAALFVGWECLLVAKYGQSHFLYHANSHADSGFAAFIQAKSALVPPLMGYLGCLGIGVALVAARVAGVPRASLAALAAFWSVVFLVIVLVPPRWDARLVGAFWCSFGVLVLLSLALCAGLLVGWRIRWNADTAFVIGWVLLELAGYFALTPFGAARRVIGLTVLGSLLAARAMSRVERIRPHRKPPLWMFAFGITAGIAVAALDTFDAFPEKVCAERAAAVVASQPPARTVWSAGHWGFQYYCDRAGMKLLVPGVTVLQPGDLLVLPRYPNEEDFFRPHIGSVSILPPEEAVEPLAEIVWDDVIAGQTVPNFYGGSNPVVGREHPRLRVVVYRMRQAWAVPGANP